LERGVQLRANTKVTAVTSREITLSDGTSITSFTLVWTAGSSPHPLLDQLNLPKEHGRIKVNANLEVEGMQGIWALGDCALIPDPAGGFCPPTAQHASREGKVLASNIIAGTRHQPLRAVRSHYRFSSSQSLPCHSPFSHYFPRLDQTEGWQSGRMYLTRNQATEQSVRGFESHPFRSH
jgi:NADH dehydrogenase FAD-containing subunit